MIGDMLLIARNDLAVMLKQKETLLWVFIMPVVFFYFIGAITSGGGASPNQTVTVALKVGDNPGFLVDELVARLKQQNMELVRSFEGEYRFEDYTRRLEIPANFTDAVLAGTPQKVTFRRRGDGMTADFDAFRVNRAVTTVLADMTASSLIHDGQITAEYLEQLHGMERALTVKVTTAGTLDKVPRGFDQSVPGIMVMFTLLILLTTGAGTLLFERRQGLLRRLASAPISREAVVGGKWLGKLSLGLVQIAFAMIIGSLAFGVSWGPNLPMVILVMLSYAAMVAALGLLVGVVARSEGQAIGLGVLAANILAALGGCWWPIEVTSPFMQNLAMFLPTGWAMDALHKLVFFGAEWSAALPHVLGMTAACLLLGKLTTRWFKFN